MVFNSFDSKEDEFNAFRDYRLRKELESGNDNAKSALLSKASIRSKLPPIAMTRLAMDTVDRDLSEINLLLHKVMNSKDAQEAYQYLATNGLLEEFYNQQARFLKFFAGVKKIPLAAFQRYWSEPKGTIVPEQLTPPELQQIQSAITSIPRRLALEREPTLGLESLEHQIVHKKPTTSVITGHITEKGEISPVEFSERVQRAEKALEQSKALIQDIESVSKVGELKSIVPSVNALKEALTNVRIKKAIHIPSAGDMRKDSLASDKSNLIEATRKLREELQEEVDQIKRGEAAQATSASRLESSKSQGLRLGARLPAMHNRYHQVGEKYINTKRLMHDGKLALYHPSNRLIGKSVSISSGMVNLIKGITFDDHFDPHLHKQLSKDERQIFDDFMNTTRLNVNPKYRMHNVHNQEGELMHEYKKLIGEMQTGNNNNKLRQNLKKVISEMYKREMISDEDMKRALATLF